LIVDYALGTACGRAREEEHRGGSERGSEEEGRRKGGGREEAGWGNSSEVWGKPTSIDPETEPDF
jgi:hypothetical protein